MTREHTTRSPSHRPKRAVRRMHHHRMPQEEPRGQGTADRRHPQLTRRKGQIYTLTAIDHLKAALGHALMPFLGGF